MNEMELKYTRKGNVKRNQTFITSALAVVTSVAFDREGRAAVVIDGNTGNAEDFQEMSELFLAIATELQEQDEL